MLRSFFMWGKNQYQVVDAVLVMLQWLMNFLFQCPELDELHTKLLPRHSYNPQLLIFLN